MKNKQEQEEAQKWSFQMKQDASSEKWKSSEKVKNKQWKVKNEAVKQWAVKKAVSSEMQWGSEQWKSEQVFKQFFKCFFFFQKHFSFSHITY